MPFDLETSVRFGVRTDFAFLDSQSPIPPESLASSSGWGAKLPPAERPPISVTLAPRIGS